MAPISQPRLPLTTELCLAAQYGDFAALNAYFDSGGDVNTRIINWPARRAKPKGRKRPRGGALLYYATFGDRDDVVRLLLARGADPNIRHGEDGLAPLHRAAFRGFYDVAKLLLDGGTDVNAPSASSNGLHSRTPLHQAAFNGHDDMIRLLLSRGATLDALDSNGRTPEALAAEEQRYLGDYESDDADDDDEKHRKRSLRAWVSLREAAADLLADVREGGGWPSYYSNNYVTPRRRHLSRLVVLRALCAQDRAKPPETVLSISALQERVLVARSLEDAQSDARALAPAPPAILKRLFSSSAAETEAEAPTPLPKEVFCLIFDFWRSTVDFQSFGPGFPYGIYLNQNVPYGRTNMRCGKILGHEDSDCEAVSYTHLTLPTKRIV